MLATVAAGVQRSLMLSSIKELTEETRKLGCVVVWKGLKASFGVIKYDCNAGAAATDESAEEEL